MVFNGQETADGTVGTQTRESGLSLVIPVFGGEQGGRGGCPGPGLTQ
jgi:hypothetical protein